MITLRKVLVIGAALAMAVSAFGQQRQGFGMRFMGGDSSGIMLLQRADVQKDLNLTDDQKTKLDAVRQTAMENMRNNMPQPGSGSFDRDAMQKAFKQMMDDMKKEVAKILTKDQMTRLREINIQLNGNTAATYPDVQKDLGLSEDQITKIKDLGSKRDEANQALFQKMRDQEISREELQDAMKKNSDAFDKEVAKILTDAQKTKLKAMGGKEFKADNNGGR